MYAAKSYFFCYLKLNERMLWLNKVKIKVNDIYFWCCSSKGDSYTDSLYLHDF